MRFPIGTWSHSVKNEANGSNALGITRMMNNRWNKNLAGLLEELHDHAEELRKVDRPALVLVVLVCAHLEFRVWGFKK
jgi:hypothetical protein